MKIFKNLIKKETGQPKNHQKENQLINQKISQCEIAIKKLESRLDILEESLNRMEAFMQSKNRIVSMLHKAGMSAKNISEILDMPLGEVELIINFIKD